VVHGGERAGSSGCLVPVPGHLRPSVGGYLSLVLLIGLVGGLAMGAVAAARRTQSSYSSFLASTNPSDVILSPAGAFSAGDLRRIAGLPQVRRVESVGGLNFRALGLNRVLARRVHAANLAHQVVILVSAGLYFSQDRVTVIQGHVNPSRPDEAVMTAAAMKLLGLHLGEVIPLGIYTSERARLPGYGTARVPPVARIDITPRPFQDHDVRPRMANGLSMDRLAHRVASVTSVRPNRRRAQMARLRRAAMILGPDRVLMCDLSSW
jgi:hypothetical protein